MGEVLAAVDFSELSEPIIALASRLAGGLGLPVRLLHVAAGESELAGYDSESFEANTPAKRAAQLRDEHGRLDQLAARIEADGVAVTEPTIVMGHTADEIVRIARELGAELVVVGSHGHGGLHHLLVGSVAEDVLRHARVPVVVVPARR